VNVEHVGLDPELLGACQDLGLAPHRKRTTRLLEMADVAVRQRHQLHFVTLRRH
jgi:hypothetical protein